MPDSNTLPDDEARKLGDQTLRRMLNTPPKGKDAPKPAPKRKAKSAS